MLAETCLRRGLLIVQTSVRYESMKLHSHDYNFYNAEKLVDDFLLNVKNRVGRSDNIFFIKCVFSLENIQLSPIENEQLIKNSRYRSTESHQTKLFNDFVYFSLSF